MSSLPDSWNVFDAEDADMGQAMQAAGSVSVPQAPAPSEVIGEWPTSLGSVTTVLSDIGSGITKIYAARQAAADAQANRDFSRFESAAQMDLRRAQVSAATELGKLNLAAQLAQARKAITGSPIFSAGGAGSLVVLALLGIGGFYLWKHAKR